MILSWQETGKKAHSRHAGEAANMATTNRRSTRRGGVRSSTVRALPAPKQAVTVQEVRKAKDGYNNMIAKLGADQANSLSASYYSGSGLTQRWQELTIMYRESWLTKKIIDLPAEDMTKAWISLDTQLSQDGIDRIEKEMRQFKVQKKMTEAIRWARLYGGTIAIILIDGQEDMMDQPLDLTLVMPGAFRGLIIKDRWSQIEPSMVLVSDMQDADYGYPEWYGVGDLESEDNTHSKSVRVHHSRILRMVGRELPYAEEEAEMYWGASELEHIFDELNKREATSSNIAQLVFQANLRVLKMSDLGQMLAMSDERTQQELYGTIQAQNMLMTSFGLQVLDQGDSFETHPYAFQGLNDIYQSFQGDIAGAAEIPATKLFGKSPDGMNSTGEGDMLNYYDSISQKQENMLRPALEKLLPIICVSALGKVPDDLEIVFEPVESSTESQRAALATQVVQSITGLFQADIISKSMAMKELKKSAYATGIGSVITDEDIEKAEEEGDLAAEQAMAQGMMPGGDPNAPAGPEMPGGPQAPGMTAAGGPPDPQSASAPGQLPQDPGQTPAQGLTQTPGLPKQPEDAADAADVYFTDAVESIRQKIGRLDLMKSRLLHPTRVNARNVSNSGARL